jgi:DnaJ family protein B protein 12
MNKDEATKCLEISKKKFQAGDTAGALRFAEKSVKLLDTKDGSNWLSFVKANPASTKPSTRSTTKNKDIKEENTRPFTPDQVKGIKRILEKKRSGDLYGIFGLEKGCSDNDIKKAYRKVLYFSKSMRCCTIRINVEHLELMMRSKQ